MARILVPLAPGFEEIEAVTIIDILRRGGLEVVTAGLSAIPVTGSHHITIQADTTLNSIEPLDFDMMVLPGGQPGTENLKSDPRILEFLQLFQSKSLRYGAICAAPSVLAAAGVIQGLRVTSFPGYEDKLGSVRYTTNRVEQDGKVLTSRGAGTAAEFALAIVAEFKGQETADKLKASMLYL